MLRLAVAVCAVGEVESVAWTVKLNGLPVVVLGVPEMTPVLGTNVSPGGSEPAVILQVMGVAPPLDVSGAGFELVIVPPRKEEGGAVITGFPRMVSVLVAGLAGGVVGAG